LSPPPSRASSVHIADRQHHQVVLLLAQLLMSAARAPGRSTVATRGPGDEPH
jgi:hypothetical protein